MRNIIRAAFLILFFSLFAQTANAAVEDCQVLKKNPDVTKGLYGLCVAYWKSGENEKVLKNYNKKKGPNDPGMPGLDDEEFLACPCWSHLTIDDVGAGLDLTQCTILDIPVFKFITYTKDNPAPDPDDFEGFSTDEFGDPEAPARCTYQLTIGGQGLNVSIEGLTLEQFETCQIELEEIAAVDFPGCGL